MFNLKKTLLLTSSKHGYMRPATKDCLLPFYSHSKVTNNNHIRAFSINEKPEKPEH